MFENEDGKLPVYERFYLGGMNTIRGYEFAKISPIDPETGDRIGGDKMWYTNTEIIFPLLETQGLRGVVFFDTGQVLNDGQNWGDSDHIAKGTGLELRWLSPMGPLRIVWGFNLDPKGMNNRRFGISASAAPSDTHCPSTGISLIFLPVMPCLTGTVCS